MNLDFAVRFRVSAGGAVLARLARALVHVHVAVAGQRLCGLVAVEYRAAFLVLADVVVATPAVGVARLTSASIPNPEQLIVVQ